MALAAAARTTISSLNAIGSSSAPPPRATIRRSGRLGQPVRQGVEAGDGGGDLARSIGALHRDRPHQHVARKAILQPVQNVADDRAGG